MTPGQRFRLTAGRRLLLACATFTIVGGSAGLARAQMSEGLGQPPPRNEPRQIEATKLSKLPKLVTFVPAAYPPAAEQQGIEADVVLLLDINERGEVRAVTVSEPSATPGLGFEEAASAAARAFVFEPAEAGGKPIAVQLAYGYKFRLKARGAGGAAGGAGLGGAGGAAGIPAVGGLGGAGGAAAPVGLGGMPGEQLPGPGGAGGAAAVSVDTPAEAAGGRPAVEARPPGTPASARVNFGGVLRERGTRLPLTGAIVVVFREENGQPVGFEATTDADGKFKFYDLAPGEWKILAEPPGYYPVRTTETIAQGEAVDVTYFIEKGAYNPYDVTVTAARPRKEVSRTIIAATEIDKIPGTAGDPLAVVQNFAGVARPPPLSGLIIVRGSAPEDSRVFVDGAEIPIIYHFGGLRTVIPVGLLDSLEFYPGNFAPMYGRATGGVVDVQIKKLQPKKIGGYADVNIYDSSFFLEVPLGKKGGIALSARRSYIDYIIQAAVPENAPVDVVTAPRYYDLHLVANYRPSPAHDLRLFMIGSDDRLEFLFENAVADPTTNIPRLTLSSSFYRSLLTYRFVPNDRLENMLRVSQGRNWTLFDAGPFVFDLDVYTSQVRDNFRYRFSDRWALHAGVDFLFSSTDARITAPLPPKEGQPADNFDPSQRVSTSINGQLWLSPAAFLEGELKPFEGLLLLPGLRVDHFTRIDQTLVQPRLTGRWQLAPRTTVKAGAGLFVQEPFFDETDPSFGNPALKAEKALHYSAGVEVKPRPHITLDLTGFYKDLWSLVSPTDRQVTDLSTGMTRALRYDNTGSGRAYGLEMVARHDFSRNLSGWLAYTLSRSERRDSGEQQHRLFDFDQTHIFTLIANYLLPRNWSIGSRLRLVSGNPITPVVGSVFNAGRDRYEAVYGSVNSARNPMFNQLDVRVDKRWIFQRWMLSVYLEIWNVYNRRNAEGLQYNFNYRQTAQQQGLPLLTILGVRGEF